VTLTTDQGPSFVSHHFKEFAASLVIKLVSSSPYCAQANGQAEVINKISISLVKKKIDEKRRHWRTVLSKALWAYMLAKRGDIKVTLFELVYGQEVVLPVEINLQTYRVAHQDELNTEDYISMMMVEIEGLPDSQFKALREIGKEKIKDAKAYNKKVREKSFQVGDLVWK
jgi:transposase InsO family protein